ncbi:galactosylgalactosylxylosylprotein 3-beta-glucuronosyltransferase 1-like isoform X3 [Ambystoma mexicanum]|uniref:galactosylgalactosylxylosylprotein 3-beta-glucuronosyltransferase 1-like isoform X3 n=1 Tax=Ambystoma mexicanum TaxID=8296 RepID=UPI0037E7B02E
MCSLSCGSRSRKEFSRRWEQGRFEGQMRCPGISDFGSRTNERDQLPTIFAITPTYARLVQKAELTRLANTFSNLPNFHWIVVEDADKKTRLVTSFLENSGLHFTHLFAKVKTPGLHNRGALQRNEALSWLRETFSMKQSVKGVVYFADDDNVYSLQLFKEVLWFSIFSFQMRNTKKVSVWPVAFVGGLLYESAVFDDLGNFKSWKVTYDTSRTFAVDMAGFAVNLNLILERKNALFPVVDASGRIETWFLEGLATVEDLEPTASNCSKILVWHTKTEKPILALENGNTDRNMEV